MDLGAENIGVASGPDSLRENEIIQKLTDAGFKITDLGNITVKERASLSIENPRAKYISEICRVSLELAEKVKATVLKNEKVLVIGGDHSVCLGAVSGASVALSGNLGLIYIDAHGDMNTSKTTLTGNIHGMHLASLLGFGDKKLKHILDTTVKVKKDFLLLIGGNDFDKAELELVRNEKLDSIFMKDILSKGFYQVFEKITMLSKNASNIWVSLDLDSIDSVYAPAAAMPNKAGFTYREITILCEEIGKSCNVMGVDLVEYNQQFDVNEKTAELAIELIIKLFGSNYSWYTKYLEKNKTHDWNNKK